MTTGPRRPRHAAVFAATLPMLLLAAAGASGASPEQQEKPQTPPAKAKPAPDSLYRRSVEAAAAAGAKSSPDLLLPLSAKTIALHANGDQLIRTGDFRAAAREYAQAAESAPRDSVLRLSTGVALSSAGMGAQALEQYRQASRLASDDVVAAMLYWGAASASGETPQTQAIHRDIAKRFARPGQTALDASGSIARLSAAVKQFPESAILNALLGDAYSLSEQWDKADASYKRAAALAPNWSKPVINLGLSQMAQGKAEVAVQTFQKALTIEPNSTQAQLGKADAQRQMGRFGDALKTYRPLNNSSPVIASQAVTGMGQALANTGNTSEAIRKYKEARALAPNDPAPLAALGDAHRQQGDFGKAAEAYRDALQLTRATGGSGGAASPTRTILYRSLAEAQLSAQKPDAALETLARAEKDDPESAALWHRLTAQAQFAKGDTKGGTESLKAALETDDALYPVDTLNAIAARGLLAQMVEIYREKQIAAESGIRRGAGRAESGGLSVYTERPASADEQAKVLTILAHLARYRKQFDEEARLREKAAALRGSGADWFLLGEACDLRSHDVRKAIAAYRNALSRGGLSDTATSWVQGRLKYLSDGINR